MAITIPQNVIDRSLELVEAGQYTKLPSGKYKKRGSKSKRRYTLKQIQAIEIARYKKSKRKSK